MPLSKSHATREVTVCAGPSLALTKYWGKMLHGVNLPATPSLGLTLTSLQSHATVSLTTGYDHVTVNHQSQARARFDPFLTRARELFDRPVCFDAVCTNNFPTSAGLASSASGFAALAVALGALSGNDLSLADLSRLARIGSGSAARAVFGGFVEWPADAREARPLYDETYWPDLRVIACLVDHGPKAVSSREAMTLARDTSPYYRDWLNTSAHLHGEALDALASKDLEKLGDIARRSMLCMFGTMLSMSPPLVYWAPESIQIMHLARTLRAQGIGAWETLDAGPQVKLLCLAADVEIILQHVTDVLPELTTIVTQVGGGPCLTHPITG
jgi:diphosphomevalonate decarboxylase